MTSRPFHFLRSGKVLFPQLTIAPAQLPETLEEAYLNIAALQANNTSHWGGWKLGGTNLASRKAFNVSEGYYGAIACDEILVQPEIVPHLALPEFRGEVEVALRLNQELDGFDAWCISLEMPCSSVRNLDELGVIALVSDRCAAGILVLGSPMLGPLPDLADTRFAQRVNGVLVAEAGYASLIDRPEALLAEFLALANRHNAPIRPGQWVATGGITPCLTYAAGDRVEVLVDDKVALDLKIAEIR